MLHQLITTPVCIFTGDPLRRFIAQNSDGLLHAAQLLAGLAGARRVLRIIEAVRHVKPLTRAARKDLQILLDILSLEHVDDLDRPESEYFARIDPADPVVTEICLLTDGLREALAQSSIFEANDLRVAALD